MPVLPGDRHWTHFSTDLKNRTIQPGGSIHLLELTEDDEEKGFYKCRDIARQALSPLRVMVNYTDIYESKFQMYAKSLEWFGRKKSDT
jgi:hypothetical protein